MLRHLRTELDVEELDTIREAFAWPDGMVPWAWLEEVGPMAVPETLRWPGVQSENWRS